MVMAKKSKILNFFFLFKIGKEKDFGNHIHQKIKNFAFFQRDKSMVLVKNSKFLNFFLLVQNKKRKFVLWCFRYKATFYRSEKKLVLESLNICIFLNSQSMVLIRNSKNVNFFFLFRLEREKDISNVLDRKQPFLDHNRP